MVKLPTDGLELAFPSLLVVSTFIAMLR